MAQIYTLDQIKKSIEDADFTEAIEQGFVQYSSGNVVVPPVGELVFDDPPGDTHIKYGYVKKQETFVIKIASGFYNNPALGLSSNSGLMLVFSQKTGEIKTILLDDGWLTDIRTAVAGRISAKYLAPEEIPAIGVIGTGIQARMQVEYLKPVTSCRHVCVWGRTGDHAQAYKKDMAEKGWEVSCMETPAQVAERCRLIITATPSKQPLLSAGDVRPGTHITAMGSDTPEKQELDTAVLAKADILVADSLSQCRTRGEISRALAKGRISEDRIIELGSLIQEPERVKRGPESISVIDLTGVAVQDIQIAEAVCSLLEKDNGEA